MDNAPTPVGSPPWVVRLKFPGTLTDTPQVSTAGAIETTTNEALPASPDDDAPLAGGRDDEDRVRGVGTRRGVVLAAGAALVTAACSPDAPATPVPTVPAAPGSLTDLAAARHLADRATFGATAAVVDRIRRIGAAAWIDEQLDPRRLPDAEARLAGYGTLRSNNAANEAVRIADEQRLFAELDHATLLRAVFSERQLYEVMCDFWTNHLNISRQAKWLTQLKTVDNETVVRPHALGRFVDLLLASAASPAMLVYLDNYASDATSTSGVNENYGRELLELHTLGIVDGAHVYTEADVVGVAKVLSGWTINWEEGPSKYSFRWGHWMHSREAVSILGGAWQRPARPNWGNYNVHGQGDAESLLRFLARHPSTARHLSTKLARRFVGDDPPRALVDRLATVYLANDTAIAPVLRSLFTSPEFATSAGTKVKRPVDFLYSALRVTRARIPSDPMGPSATTLRSATRMLGQPLFERPSPDGWPDRAAVWSSSQGLLRRWEGAGRLARNALTDPTKADRIEVDPAALLPAPLPATTRALVVALNGSVCQRPLSAADADTVCAAVGVAPTAAATEISARPERLAGVLGLLLSHPRFQYR